jgi:hypothetical protein
VTRLLTLLAVLCLATACYAQGGGERGSAEATVNGKKISISYGRPSLKGRDLLGQAPVGTVWRLGMNQATELTTTGDLDVGGTKVPAGKYTLWAKRVSESEWHLALHPKTGVWGAPALTEGYIAEMPLTLSKASAPVEELTIGVADAGGKAQLKIEWGTMVLSGDIGVK